MPWVKQHNIYQLLTWKELRRSLFQVKDRKQGELIGLCPVHDDHDPSFSYNPVKDLSHCFSCGFKGDIITLWSRVNGYMDQAEGFKAFCDCHGISDEMNLSSSPAGGGQKKKKEGPPPLNEAYALLGELSDSWIERLQQTRGWTPEVIRSEGLRAQTHYQVKDSTEIRKLNRANRIAIPIFDQQGHVRNIRLYKPGAKKMKIISWGTKYGEARLYPAVPLPKDPLTSGGGGVGPALCPKSWVQRHHPDHQAKEMEKRPAIHVQGSKCGHCL